MDFKKFKKVSNYIGICMLHQNENNVTGLIKFKEIDGKIEISYKIKGLSNGIHGIHIHEYGDLTNGCISTGGHYNPHNMEHGDRTDKIRHVGDLGNIYSINNLSEGSFIDNIISIRPENINSIIGRAVVIHEHGDDLGKGNNEESLKTGNAGSRIACGIIGLGKNII